MEEDRNLGNWNLWASTAAPDIMSLVVILASNCTVRLPQLNPSGLRTLLALQARDTIAELGPLLLNAGALSP